MTVKELIELNNFIGDISITVRDNGKKIKSFYIGEKEGKKPPYPDKNGIYKEISINSIDDGKDYYNLLINKIPKDWLEFKVQSFRVWKSYRGVYSNHSLEHILIDVYSDGWIDKTETEKENNKQLDGQMEITDFQEVLP